MAFRMAENSLFSVLLRSPWWYSAVIAILLIVASLLAFGGKFLVFGITAALPFTGIAAYAVFQQLKRPSAKRVAEVAELARKMSAQEVASRIADSYKSERYDAAVFKGNSANMELTLGAKKLLLSTARIKAANTGIEPLKKLIDAGAQTEATGYLYVTLGELSQNAWTFAKDNDIRIIQREELATLFGGKAILG